jgi:cytosine/adenosine deaminase-related metal-dependent hydrolase
MKLKNGIAPIRELREAGVTVALGCDNCSCGDCQNIFQAMKLFCLLAAVADPAPTGVHARHAIEAATLGGARAVGLDGKVGAIRAGMAADLALINLDDVSYVPLNSVARQLVFSECGRGVETTIVGGRIVMRDGRMTTIDESALRAEIAELMPAFLRDVAQVRATSLQAQPYLLQANRNVGREDVGLHRYVGGRTP